MTNPNDAAFSKAAFYHPEGGIDTPQEGLSKREYFAAMAMQGYIASGLMNRCVENTLAMYSVKVADALIAELNK
jgi:hypothetical protein